MLAQQRIQHRDGDPGGCGGTRRGPGAPGRDRARASWEWGRALDTDGLGQLGLAAHSLYSRCRKNGAPPEEKGQAFMDKRVLFARISWMKFYAGALDEKPVGGGSYIKEHIGSELFNFKPVRGFLYGFAKGGSRTSAFNLKRIDPKVGEADKLEHVTVVFVAKHPGGGQRVVGWYENATVYRKWEKHPIQPVYRKGVAFCIKAAPAEARLLPTRWRTELVPGQKGGMGESNVRYPVDHGQAAFKPWMLRILKYIDQYDGPNLLKDQSVEAEQTEPVDSVIETSAGFETNPEIRRMIEEHSVRVATRYFEKLGYKVHPKGKPFDLLCVKKGGEKFVEVKGTRTDGSTVALTRNEVDFLTKNARSAAMFVLHSIKIKPGKRPKAFGGRMRLIEPWNPSCGELKPITFFLHFR